MTSDEQTRIDPLRAGGQTAPSSARSFFDFNEATATVLDLLARQLPDCAVFIVYQDDDAELLRVVDFRGPETFGVTEGMALALPDETPAGRAPDPAPAILSAGRVSHAESFIGIPLELQDGRHFGTLCAISTVAKRFRRDEIDLLTVLGRVIVNELDRETNEIELQRQHADLVEHAEQLRSDAFTDSLTGVANRRSFERSLGREWKASNQGGAQSYLMLIDIDDFKSVNDRLGHVTGDRVLQHCAKALQETARGTDVVGRIGGDEFAVILVGCQDDDAAAGYRERAQAEFDALLKHMGVRAGFSAGHQALRESASPARAMELADQAMYWHKRRRSGRPLRGDEFTDA